MKQLNLILSAFLVSLFLLLSACTNDAGEGNRMDPGQLYKYNDCTLNSSAVYC